MSDRPYEGELVTDEGYPYSRNSPRLYGLTLRTNTERTVTLLEGADALVPGNVVQSRKNRKIRVVHAVARLGIAGMENVVASLVRGVSPSRYQSAIWCIEAADTLGQELRAEGYEVVEWGRRWRRDVVLFFRLAAFMRRERIDILHCHDELSWFYGAIGAWLGGMTRVLVTMHGRRTDISRRHLLEQRFLASLTRTIVCVSQHLREQIIDEVKVAPEKVIAICNGIAVASQKPDRAQRCRARTVLGLPDEAKVVGAVGRLAAVKNLELLIAAAAEARATLPDLYVVLIGDGPCRAQERCSRSSGGARLVCL